MVDVVDPETYRISRSEKYRNLEIVRRVTDQANRNVPNLLGDTIDVLEAWGDATLSEGQTAQALRVDRLTARTLRIVYKRHHSD